MEKGCAWWRYISPYGGELHTEKRYCTHGGKYTRMENKNGGEVWYTQWEEVHTYRKKCT